jgi:hypothetical protein
MFTNNSFLQYSMFCKFSTDGDQNPISSRINLKWVYVSSVQLTVCAARFNIVLYNLNLTIYTYIYMYYILL